MGNYSNEVNLLVIKIDTDNLEVGLRKIFELDSDFTENQEYWREDTEELGFETEADRVLAELFDDEKFKKASLEEQVESICNCSAEQTGTFFLGNCSYCRDYKFEITEIEGSSIVILSIAFIS